MSVGVLPWWLRGNESACSAGSAGEFGSIPGLGRSLGGGNGDTLQCPCLENPMDRGAWCATVHRITESDTTEVTKHSWFTVLCYFLVYSKLIQWYIHIYLLFFKDQWLLTFCKPWPFGEYDKNYEPSPQQKLYIYTSIILHGPTLTIITWEILINMCEKPIYEYL